MRRLCGSRFIVGSPKKSRTSVGSIMDGAGWVAFAGLQANEPANGARAGAGSGRSSSESELSLERLQRRLSRVACDVPDGPLQELAALGYELSNLRSKTTRLNSPEADLDTEFERMMSQLSNVEALLRSMLFGLEGEAGRGSD